MSDGTRDRGRGPFGPLEMLDEVQREAFEAALRVTAELSSLGGGLADLAWWTDPAGAPRHAEAGGPDERPPLDVGRLRGDVTKAAETFADLLRALLDVGFDAIDELTRRPVARPEGAAAPGSTALVTSTIRNGVESATGLVPHVPQLATVDGVVLDAAVRVEPIDIDLQPHERATVRVGVEVPVDALPGRYHGLLLVRGLSDAAQAITVDVTAPEPAGGDR